MSKENSNDVKCSHCGNKLTTYEVADNIYAGLNEQDYVCYSCQSFFDETVDDPEEDGKYNEDDLWD